MTGRAENDARIYQKIQGLLEGKNPILNEFYLHMFSDGKSMSTSEKYLRYVIDFLESMGVDDCITFTSTTIQRYFNNIAMKSGTNGNSIQAIRWSALNYYGNFLALNNYISANPVARTKRPKNNTENEVVYLEKEEITTIFRNIRENAKPMTKNRDLCIMALGLTTGLRVSAIAQINIEDIDFGRRTIKVIEKGNKHRVIHYNKSLDAPLNNWLADRAALYTADMTGPLFLSKARQRMSEPVINRMMKRYSAGINKSVHPHIMRKTAAMTLVKSGCDTLAIMKTLGHKNIATTMHYVDAYNQEKQRVTETLGNMLVGVV